MNHSRDKLSLFIWYAFDAFYFVNSYMSVILIFSSRLLCVSFIQIILHMLTTKLVIRTVTIHLVFLKQKWPNKKTNAQSSKQKSRFNWM